jgi:aryl-alcohol dehydrogenase-like predicted oxidoreductase
MSGGDRASEPRPGSGGPLDARAAIGGGGFGGIGSPRALIGRGLDEQGTRAVLDRCLDLDVTIIDTAHSYAAGESQRMIGRWLAQDQSRRPRVAIVDKVGVVDGPDGLVADLSTGAVARCSAEGRTRLGVGSVDVVMTHGPDPHTPIRETLEAFATLIEEGQARHWGLSNVDIDGLTAWLDEANRLGVLQPLLVENEFNLLARGDESSVLPLCRNHHIGFLAFSPLAGGVLSGKYRRGEEPPPGSRLSLRPDAAASMTEDLHERLEILAARAASFGVSSAGLALAWVMAQPGVRPIAGASRPAHLDAVAEAMAVSLTRDQAAELAAELSRP